MRERARSGGTTEQEVLQAKAEMERRLEAAAERERAALEKQRVELTGTAEEKLEYARRGQQARAGGPKGGPRGRARSPA